MCLYITKIFFFFQLVYTYLDNKCTLVCMRFFFITHAHETDSKIYKTSTFVIFFFFVFTFVYEDGNKIVQWCTHVLKNIAIIACTIALPTARV